MTIKHKHKHKRNPLSRESAISRRCVRAAAASSFWTRKKPSKNAGQQSIRNEPTNNNSSKHREQERVVFSFGPCCCVALLYATARHGIELASAHCVRNCIRRLHCNATVLEARLLPGMPRMNIYNNICTIGVTAAVLAWHGMAWHTLFGGSNTIGSLVRLVS
mmetsp:Transcript_25737/g.54176  ORF Transcript_25737/g.54176 Transcript_25737/m.54176 type:complete len:162 (+) Transcript_25737:1160-1645(+)